MARRGSIIGSVAAMLTNSGVWFINQAYRRVGEQRWPRTEVVGVLLLKPP